jgi:hypothetical protein
MPPPKPKPSATRKSKRLQQKKQQKQQQPQRRLRGRPRKHLHPYEDGPDDYTVSLPTPLTPIERLVGNLNADLLRRSFVHAVNTTTVDAGTFESAMEEWRNGTAMSEVASNAESTSGPDPGVVMAQEVNQQLQYQHAVFKFGENTQAMREQTRREEERLVGISERGSRGGVESINFLKSRSKTVRRPGTGSPSEAAVGAAINYTARQSTPEAPVPASSRVTEDELLQAAEEASNIVGASDTELSNDGDGGDENGTNYAGTGGSGLFTQTSDGGSAFFIKTSENQAVLDTNLQWSKSKRLRGKLEPFTTTDTFVSDTDQSAPMNKSMKIEGGPQRTKYEDPRDPRGRRNRRAI